MSKKTASILALILIVLSVILTFIPQASVIERNVWRDNGLVGDFIKTVPMSFIEIIGQDYEPVINTLIILLISSSAMGIIGLTLIFFDKKGAVVKAMTSFSFVGAALFVAVGVKMSSYRYLHSDTILTFELGWGFYVGCVLFFVALTFASLILCGKVEE